jgi:N-acetylglucosaminyl-diphospho-decaprenol L-rhamnosyltransferase
MSVKALDCLFASKGEFDLEVFVIDNASKDDSVNVIRDAYQNLTMIENSVNVGFGRANNQVLDKINGDYVLLLNTDAFVAPDTLQKTVTYMQAHARCGILGVRLLGRDGVQQPSCRYFPTPVNLFATRLGLNRIFPQIQLVDDLDWDPSVTTNCDWVPGCYYLIRRPLIKQVGLFDPLYFLYCEEVDHCFAAKKAGWEVTYYADAQVVHVGGESAKSEGKLSETGRQVPMLQIESELLYFRKNHGLWGVLTHLFLSNLANLIEFMKDLLKLKSPKILSYHFKLMFSSWKLFLLTRFGTKSTR